MEIVRHKLAEKIIAEILSDNVVVGTTEEALELVGNLYFQGLHGILLYEKNITPDFFDLKNGLAGEILQKFSNYQMSLAIVGDFDSLSGKSIQDFMLESNKGTLICFVASSAEALDRLAQ